MARAFGIVSTSGNRYQVEGLGEYRPIGAITILGRYRTVDFPISNMVNSGIDQIQVFVNKNPRSIAEHLGTGRHYNMNSKRGRLQILFSEPPQGNELYNTDVTAFAENLEYIGRMDEEYVVVAPGYMIFTQDFDKLLDEHIQSRADITLLYHRVENARDHFLNCDILQLGKEHEVLSIERNGGAAKNRAIFMDTYVMKKSLFIDLVSKAREISSVFTLSQVINQRHFELKLYAVAHRGFFAGITDFRSFYDANMELLDIEQARSVFKDNWPIYTRTTDSCPTRYFEGARVMRSMISNGCIIKGNVENSVIGRGCTIEKGATVKNSIVLPYAEIKSGVTVESQVIDKWAKISQTKEIRATAEAPGYIHRNDVL